MSKSNIKPDYVEKDRFTDETENYFNDGLGSTYEKLTHFAKYVPRQNLTRFLTKYELFKKVLDVEGSIVECGVNFGGGLMSFAKFSSIFEPVNYTRKIIGFDTFTGFPELTKYDLGGPDGHIGGMKSQSFDDLITCSKIYDSNRLINHINKIELVKGDATKTIPEYFRKNEHTVVSLLYLDFDIYKPTKVALENIVPRMPKGSIIAFDELNHEGWKGETKALMDTLGISKLRIKRFHFDTYVSYAILE